VPQRPKRPCRHPGCPETHRNQNGYCDDHAQDARAYDRNRPHRSKRGYDRRWIRARALYLAEHPFCVVCQAKGKMIVATEVDHITPHKGDQDLFWDESNWQPLCKNHHSAKTARETFGPPTLAASV